MGLREQIVEIIEPLLAEDDWGDGVAETTADHILALNEMVELQRDREELEVYRANCEYPD